MSSYDDARAVVEEEEEEEREEEKADTRRPLVFAFVRIVISIGIVMEDSSMDDDAMVTTDNFILSIVSSSSFIYI